MKTPRSRKDMIAFLGGHFRYDTMNSWNRSTSYARNVKLHHIKFPDKETEDRAWEMLEVEEAFDDVKFILEQFAEAHNWEWQIGFNGRSGGYLVLYQGGRKLHDYRSWCSCCGQGNFNEATDDNKKCGRCGADARYNATRYQTFTYPGKGVDGERDWEDWDTDSLRSRVKLVMEFDRACEDAVQCFINFCKENKAQEETVMVPKKITVAVPV